MRTLRVLVYLCLTLALGQPAFAQHKPNVLLIFLDNFGCGEPGFNFPHTWVPKAALPILEDHIGSLKKYPPVPTGATDPYEPPY